MTMEQHACKEAAQGRKQACGKRLAKRLREAVSDK
jgi:hypothetical protein